MWACTRSGKSNWESGMLMQTYHANVGLPHGTSNLIWRRISHLQTITAKSFAISCVPCRTSEPTLGCKTFDTSISKPPTRYTPKPILLAQYSKLFHSTCATSDPNDTVGAPSSIVGQAMSRRGRRQAFMASARSRGARRPASRSSLP